MNNKKILTFALLNLSFISIAKAAPQSYIVYDFANNIVLEEKNINNTQPIASLTKLMTANVFLALNKNPNCKMSITDADTDTIKGTRTRLPKNTPIACDDLLKAMLVSSDNYAASALGRAIPVYTKSEFVKEMNRYALSIGMLNTHFVDTSGLSPQNVSSVSDLVILSGRSILNDDMRYITSMTNTEVNSIDNPYQKVAFRNSNSLVRNGTYQPLISKTGYIKESGYNLVFVNAYSCNNNSVLGIISLNNPSSSARAAFTQEKLRQYQCS